ncbi:MAG: hypothetical protein COA78_22410 [Blastopirellula sp.]|nr:MAG: hypothetical protein COA78_22410 [Blastopirellula sp.]
MATSPIRSQNCRSGYALIELPLVLVILSALGLAFVFILNYFSEGVAWYIWIIGPLLPTLTLIVLGMWIELRRKRAKVNSEETNGK